MKKRTVLFVDDDAQYLGLIASIVEDSGCEIRKATCGKEALSILASTPVALMVTDLQMPGMDGLELSGLARQIDPGLEIVLVTGAVSAEVLRKARTIGIDMVLAKPCRVEEMIGIVKGTEGNGGETPVRGRAVAAKRMWLRL